jgi:hypothetical protein
MNKILEFVKGGVGMVPGLEEVERKLEGVMSVNEVEGEKLVGFEGLCERDPSKLFSAPPDVKPSKSASLDFYFNTMARQSRDAIRGKFALPIGARFSPGASEADQFALEGLAADYSFFPAIDFHNPAEEERYLKLARGLLTNAIRFNWGLLEFFHDLVDPPPYVRRVEVSQRGRALYSAEWTDRTLEVSGTHPNDNKKAADYLAKKKKFDHKYKYVRVWGRELPERLNSSPLEAGVEARVRIDFGAKAEGFGARPEAMKEVSVAIGGELVPGQLVENGSAWIGRFTPNLEDGEEEKELQIEIDGRDAQTHPDIPGRLALPREDELYAERGYKLDDEPESPAKTSSDPPYHVLNYQPGTDVNHKLLVRAAAASAEEESAAISSPDLFFEIAGDIVKPTSGEYAWSFNLTLNATAEVLAELVSKEEWTIYPDGRLYSTYSRTERRGGRIEGRFANVTNLSQPPEERLTPSGVVESDLDIFKTDPDGHFVYGGNSRDGNRLSHWIWVTGRIDPFAKKLRFKGRGRDGSIHQAEFVFDSREWAPAGKDSSGQTIYKKTARSVGKAGQRPLGKSAASDLEDWKKAAAGGTPAARKPAQSESRPPAGATTGQPTDSGTKAVFRRGEELLKNRDYWGAADCFRKTLQEFPAESNQGLGLCYYAGGLYEAALKHFAEADRFNPKAPLTVLYLATCNDKLGRAGEAVRRYEEYLTLTPTDPKMTEFVRSRLLALRGR